MHLHKTSVVYDTKDGSIAINLCGTSHSLMFRYKQFAPHPLYHNHPLSAEPEKRRDDLRDALNQPAVWGVEGKVDEWVDLLEKACKALLFISSNL